MKGEGGAAGADSGGRAIETAFWRSASEIRRILKSNLSDKAKLDQIEMEIRHLREDVVSSSGPGA